MHYNCTGKPDFYTTDMQVRNVKELIREICRQDMTNIRNTSECKVYKLSEEELKKYKGTRKDDKRNDL